MAGLTKTMMRFYYPSMGRFNRFLSIQCPSPIERRPGPFTTIAGPVSSLSSTTNAGRHVKQRRTCAVKGAGQSVPHYVNFSSPCPDEDKIAALSRGERAVSDEEYTYIFQPNPEN